MTVQPSVETEVKAQAWDEGFDIGANTPLGNDTNPYRSEADHG